MYSHIIWKSDVWSHFHWVKIKGKAVLVPEAGFVGESSFLPCLQFLVLVCGPPSPQNACFHLCFPHLCLLSRCCSSILHRRTYVMTSGPPRHSPHLRIPNLITSVKASLTDTSWHSQVPGIETWNIFGSHYSSYHAWDRTHEPHNAVTFMKIVSFTSHPPESCQLVGLRGPSWLQDPNSTGLRVCIWWRV